MLIPVTLSNINWPYTILLTGILLTVFFVSCSPETDETVLVEVVELDDYETIVSFEDKLLATPVSLNFDGASSLFVYDLSESTVLELDLEGNIIQEIGRRGRGPGEFRILNNIYIQDDALYFIDAGQYLIHKYNRNGEHLASLDYGELGYISSAPMPPVNVNQVIASDLTHQPHITGTEELLLYAAFIHETPDHLFDIVNWQGDVQNGVGKIPEGSVFEFQEDAYRRAIADGNIPNIDKLNAFPVNDRSNPNEVFIIYSATAGISKYSMSGDLLWEQEAPGVEELDSVKVNLFKTMGRLSRGSRMIFNQYLAGRSTPDGDLYLATNSNPVSNTPLWIHQFNPNGELAGRFKIISDVAVPPVFDIDHINRRIFVVTEEAEIRAYGF